MCVAELSKLTNFEMATYLGMATMMMTEAMKGVEDKDMLSKVASALCTAQLDYFNRALLDFKEALDE